MRAKLKYLLILAVVLLLSGCSAMRKGKGTSSVIGPAVSDYTEMTNTVLENNITERGFEIRKGSIELEGTEIEGKFGLHARLNSKGDFYASVRGPLGIELARILMVGNEIAAIDRFNRKVYVGEKDVVMNKNGLPEDFMKILFGDMPEMNEGNFRQEGYNEITVMGGDSGFEREMTICTDEMKICREKISATESGHNVYFTFNAFRMSGERKYASEITMEERKKMFHVKLSIDDLIYGYDSEIEFNLPPYERERL
jgi:hypothetical protein